MGSIYCITNKVNGKKYVGKTVRTVEDRWDSHIKSSRYRDDLYFMRAIRKHGPDCFQVSVLEVVEDDLLDDAERKWIKELNTTDREIGYNSTHGGEGFSTGSLNPNVLNPRRGPDNASYGKPVPPEVREKISKTLTGLLVGEKNPFYGRTHSEETRKLLGDIQRGQKRRPCSEETKVKISEAQKGRKLTEEHKAKLSAAKIGKKLSPEHCLKLSEAQKNRRHREAA